jgi:hypothetical protein
MDVCPRFSVLCCPVFRAGPPFKKSYQLPNRSIIFRK